MRTLFRHPLRVWHVVAVFFGLFIAPALHLPGADHHPGPVRLRLAFERLGGAWVKLGQMLALRYDILPVPYCDELFRLLNQVAPFSYDEVREIIRRELGAEPEVVFATFEHQSFAAASIGQVHRASLHNGDVVAVKVQRPHIRETLKADIDLMYSVTWLLDWTRLFGGTKSRDVIDEFARWTADEVDYLVEARQAVLLREHAKGDRYERIARVYRDYTTSRVLTTELIEGIPLVEIMVAKRDGDLEYLERLEKSGHDLDRIVRHLDWNMLNQVFVFGYFHADLHPANMFVLDGDAIGYVDFGIVGQLPNRVRESLTRYSWLLFRGEVEPAVRELMRWLAPGPATDAERRPVAADPGPPGVPVRRDRRPVAGHRRGPRADPGEPREPVFQARRRHPRHDPGAAADDVAEHRRLAQDARHARRAAPPAGRRTTTWPRTCAASCAGSPASRASRWPTRGRRSTGCTAARARSSGRSTSWSSSRARSRRSSRRRARCSASATGSGTPSGRSCDSGRAVLLVGGALYLVLQFPDDTKRAMPIEGSYPFVNAGLLVLLLILIAALINYVRGLGQND